MNTTVTELDKTRLRAAFEQAAPRYDEAAVLQREVGERLLERLDLFRLAPRRILDLGAGTGAGARQLERRYRKAQIIALDLAPGMLREARQRTGWFSRQRFVCADAERLPLADDSIDLIFSNLTLQWCPDLTPTFRDCLRVLRPGGVLLFSTLGPDTLKELRASWAAVDPYTHVNPFLDMHDVGDALLGARLADPVVDMEYITLTYGDALQLMRDLKTLGANHIGAGRAPGLTGRRRLHGVIEAYETYRRDGRLPATYEVVYGHAFAPDPKPVGQRTSDGGYAIPLTSLRRR